MTVFPPNFYALTRNPGGPKGKIVYSYLLGSLMDFSRLVASIRLKLPIQNPLHSYVHNNILQMFEDKDFHHAVKEAGKLYRARAYWPEYKYIERFEKGKITEQDLLAAIDHYAGSYEKKDLSQKLNLSEKEFYYHLMFTDLNLGDKAQEGLKDAHLWSLCLNEVQGQNLILSRSITKWRGKEYWESYYNEFFAESIHPYIIRLISSYVDQGQSYWGNPFHYKGFWSFFLYDVEALSPFSNDWQKILVKKVKKYQTTSSEDVIQEELKAMGIPEEAWEEFLLDILFDLKGWSGMVNKLESEPWQAPVVAPKINLVDYMAALVLLESSIDTFYEERFSVDLSLIHGRKEQLELHSYQLALALYQITKSFKLPERWMQRYTAPELLQIIDEVEMSLHTDKVRLWHEAYEHHYHREAIEAIALHDKSHTPQDKNFDTQILFCIDDREESIRRHLEEIDAKVRTYGVVGFFGIDMKFASYRNERLIAQCPPVVTPSRIVKEIVKEDTKFNRVNLKRAGGDLNLYYNTRTLFRGFVSSLVLGFLSIFPMISQVFFPKFSVRFRKKLSHLMNPEPKTEIILDKVGESQGYSFVERAGIVASILKMCGMTNDLSSLVIVLAHGSASSNNPFKQSYGCGACGGNAGIPNSRAFVKMANDPLVRQELKHHNIIIPEDTFFISGYHDTCTDEVNFYNLHLLPEKYKEQFQRVRSNLKEASKRNAYERCQRFTSFSKNATTEKALKHVEERAIDIAQPRPEYGHCTNALAIVAKRDLTHCLFLNRRAFLLTYDWETDLDGSVLAQVVLGGVPVAVNINMDYYFSCVDNENFGCGSKLPLNMTSLLGVMTGAHSDLRIGMARQMVEIHEPIRNMTIIEAPLAKVKSLFEGHERLRKLLYHHWMRLVVKDPLTNEWWMFGVDKFEPIRFDRKTMKIYANSMDLLHQTHSEEDFAEIGS